MTAANIKKTLCTAMAAIMAICLISCGEVKSSPAAGAEDPVTTERVTTRTERRPESVETTDAPDIQSDFPEETRPGDVQIDISYAPVVIDKYSNANYIEAIAEDRYLIMYNISLCKGGFETSVIIYDSASDSEVNSFYLPDTSLPKAEINYGNGFGFVTKGQDMSLSDPDAEWDLEEAQKTFCLYAEYYDINGELVNEFVKTGTDKYDCSYAFAPDGSAFYVAEDDRVQCACGYDFNPDFTTKIYKINGDGTQEVIREFDHHTMPYIEGMTNDGRLAVVYSYNPNDITVYDHDEYEMGANYDNMESGLGFISLEEGSAPEVTKVYTLDNYPDFLFTHDDTFTLIDDDVITRIFPDGEGGYKEESFEDSIGIDGYYTELYVSSDGKYAVYPTYTEDFADTTVNVVYFDNNKPRKIFERFFEGKKVEFDPDRCITIFDAKSGELVGRYDCPKEGLKKELFRINIY